MMSIGDVNVQGLEALGLLPWQVQSFAQLFVKPAQKKARVRVVDRIMVPTHERVGAYRYGLSVGISDAGLPKKLSTHLVTHMSGLRGLFVWKQKATTDVPDA